MDRLGDRVTDIQHIGSTAVSGIPAKPIIDMSLGLRTLNDAKKLIKPLADLGYTWRKTAGSTKRWLFVKGPEEKRTHYLHVMRYNGGAWKHDVLFRDYLRANPAYAQRYGELKTTLARKYGDNRGMYTKGKASFIRTTIKLARKVSWIKLEKLYGDKTCHPPLLLRQKIIPADARRQVLKWQRPSITTFQHS